MSTARPSDSGIKSRTLSTLSLTWTSTASPLQIWVVHSAHVMNPCTSCPPLRSDKLSQAGGEIVGTSASTSLSILPRLAQSVLMSPLKILSRIRARRARSKSLHAAAAHDTTTVTATTSPKLTCDSTAIPDTSANTPCTVADNLSTPPPPAFGDGPAPQAPSHVILAKSEHDVVEAAINGAANELRKHASLPKNLTYADGLPGQLGESPFA